jgi:hypothetical protein
MIKIIEFSSMTHNFRKNYSKIDTINLVIIAIVTCYLLLVSGHQRIVAGIFFILKRAARMRLKRVEQGYTIGIIFCSRIADAIPPRLVAVFRPAGRINTAQTILKWVGMRLEHSTRYARYAYCGKWKTNTPNTQRIAKPKAHTPLTMP